MAIRAKGSNSRRLTEKYGPGSYYGLDKFSLASSFQDNFYLKTWITYDVMNHMEVPTPLCSWVWVQVNREDGGLFLSIKEPEKAVATYSLGMSDPINDAELYVNYPITPLRPTML